MKRTNIILTSMVAIMMAVPSFATSYKANDTATCNTDVLGTDTGTASATAGFDPLKFTCGAGTYLPNGDSWSSDTQYTPSGGCATCQSGNYCVGSASSADATDGEYEYSDTVTKGSQSCPSGYTLSESGATSANDCYRNCAAGDVAHLKSGGTVTGKYYSNDTNMCEPSDSNQCAAGYHYVAGFDASTMATTIGTDKASGYTSNKHDGSEYTTRGMSHDTIGNDSMAFAVDYGNNKGMIKGHGRCSTRQATKPWVGTNGAYVLQSDGTVTTLTDETDPNTGGQYCYCHIESYTLNGATQSLSAPWVFHNDRGGADDCADGCANRCANGLRDGGAGNLAFRSAVFGLIQSGPAQCSANEITINWGGYGANNDQNETNTCTYDGTLTAPSMAPTKRGHNFTGWTFGQ